MARAENNWNVGTDLFDFLRQFIPAISGMAVSQITRSNCSGVSLNAFRAFELLVFTDYLMAGTP